MSQIDPYESSRLSLLDVALEKLRSNNKKGMLNRIILASKLTSQFDKPEKKALGTSFEKFLKNCTAQTSGEPPSGLMLFYTSHALHCLESSQETIMMFVKEMASGAYADMLSDTKVLSFTENITSRKFSLPWMQESMPARALEEKFTTSESDGHVSDENFKFIIS